jgi:hypothetical protein
MGTRYTTADVDSAVRGLNRVAGFTAEEIDLPLWERRENGDNVAMVGRYYVEGAYSGWKLVQVLNAGGGVRDVLSAGYTTKRELYHLVHAYRMGVEAGTAGDHYGLAAVRARAGVA